MSKTSKTAEKAQAPHRIVSSESLARLLLAGWILVIIVRFALTAWSAVQHPFNPGDDLVWRTRWLAVVAVVSGSVFLFCRQAVKWVWLAAIGITAAAIIFLSQSLGPALVACWVLALSAGCGDRFLRLCGVRDTGDLFESIVLRVPLGLTLIAFSILILGLLKLLNVAAIVTVLAAATVATIRFNWPSLERTESTLDIDVLKVIAGLAFLLNLCWAVAPEIEFDALNYHLAVPRIYLQQGAVLEQPNFFHSYFAHLIEMIFVPCLALGGQSAVKLLILGAGTLCAMGVFVLGRMVFDRRVGLWAAVLFYTTPVTMFLSGAVNTDLVTALFLTVMAIAFLRWRARREASWLYVLANLAGAAFAGKLTATFGLVLPGVIVFWYLVRSQEWKQLVIGALIFIVMTVPWFAVTYAWTGSPVFPFYNRVFKSPDWKPVNTFFDSGDFGIGVSPSSLIRLPFRVTFNTERFRQALPRGSAGIALVLALPWIVLVFRNRSSQVAFLLATSVAYLVLWAFNFQYVRYFVPILPVVCVLAASIATKRMLPALFVPIVLQVFIVPIHYWQIPERFPLDLAFGRESRDTFLTRALGGYPIARYLNTVVPAGERIVGVGAEPLRFYLNPPLDTLSESLINGPLRDIAAMPSDAALAAKLIQLHYTHILAENTAIKNPTPEFPYLNSNFLSRYTAQEMCDPAMCVYKLQQ